MKLNSFSEFIFSPSAFLFSLFLSLLRLTPFLKGNNDVFFIRSQLNDVAKERINTYTCIYAFGNILFIISFHCLVFSFTLRL